MKDNNKKIIVFNPDLKKVKIVKKLVRKKLDLFSILGLVFGNEENMDNTEALKNLKPEITYFSYDEYKDDLFFIVLSSAGKGEVSFANWDSDLINDRIQDFTDKMGEDVLYSLRPHVINKPDLEYLRNNIMSPEGDKTCDSLEPCYLLLNEDADPIYENGIPAYEAVGLMRIDPQILKDYQNS